MSDIAEIKKLEEKQSDRISEEREKAKERISRAEADASFRVGEGQKETKGIIDEIIARGKEDGSKEVLFIKNENTARDNKFLEREAEKINEAVSFIAEKLQQHNGNR